jgi:hypothetical protein
MPQPNILLVHNTWTAPTVPEDSKVDSSDENGVVHQ